MSEDYTVQRGDCIGSVAYEHGFFWETLWNLPENSALKNKRTEHNLLATGDVVHIPDLRWKEESGGTEQQHRFRRKGVPSHLRLRVFREAAQPPPPAQAETPPEDQDQVVMTEAEERAATEEPAAHIEYVLEVEGLSRRGKADADGKIDVPISPAARDGRLVLEPGTLRERVIPLYLGHLEPIEMPGGQAQRLFNLGFVGSEGLVEGGEPELAEAASAFQKAHGLSVTGEVDLATRDKLKEAHGS